MQLTNLFILASALGVAVAHPSGHGHRQAHEKRATYVKNNRPTKIAAAEQNVATTTSAAPVVATTTSAAPTTTSAVSSSSSSSSGSYVPFCSGSSKRATAAEIAYQGNTGTTYGCNIMEVASNIASLYNYTMTFDNVASETYQVICWNKIGNDGQIDGFFKGKGEAVTFNLAAGATQVVAFEANSQGACAFAPGSIPTSTYGEYLGSWVEFDFADAANSNWSGADCSCLAAVSASANIPGCQVCSGSTCSTINPGGSGTNAYTAGTADEDGIGLNLQAGNVALNVKVGYGS